MSICTISIVSEDRALVCVDTAVTIHTARGFEFSEVGKLHVLTHAGVVLAAVGSVAVAQAAFQWASRAGSNLNFDVIAHAMSAALDCIHTHEMDECAGDPQAAAAVGGENHVYLVGWSPAAARMRGIAFIKSQSAKCFEQFDTTPRWAQPHDPASEARQPMTVDEIAARASGIVRYGKLIDPAVGFGGRLVVADVRRDSITTVMRPVLH